MHDIQVSATKGEVFIVYGIYSPSHHFHLNYTLWLVKYLQLGNMIGVATSSFKISSGSGYENDDSSVTEYFTTSFI